MKIIKKGTKLYSILKLKCPRCHEGNLFTDPKLFVFSHILEMPNHCSHCGQDFKIEPGFYTAALWISYPIVLLLFVPIIILGLSLDNFHKFLQIIYPLIILLCLFAQIPIMRISRAILINISVDYQDNAHK